MLLVFSGTILVIMVAVALHYEVLTHLSENHFNRPWPSRLLLPVGVLVVILTHVIEIWIFAFLYYFLLSLGDVGDVIGEFKYTIKDCAYFSFVNYTSLGYGDLVPIGNIRFAAGSEALTGLVLIAWTASFTYLQMQTLVGSKKNKK